MRTVRTRVGSILLVLAMLLALMPTAVLASGDEPQGVSPVEIGTFEALKTELEKPGPRSIKLTAS